MALDVVQKTLQGIVYRSGREGNSFIVNNINELLNGVLIYLRIILVGIELGSSPRTGPRPASSMPRRQGRSLQT